MVGRASRDDLAAATIGQSITLMFLIFGQGVLMALDPYVAQAIGARKPSRVGRAYQRGICLAVVLAALLSVPMLMAESLLNLLQQPPHLIPDITDYVRWQVPGILPYLWFLATRQTLQAMGLTRPVVWTILVANAANFFLNWVLIYGNLGAPAWGAMGSSIATSICRWGMAIAIAAFAWPRVVQLLRPWSWSAARPAQWLPLVRVGTPIAFQLLIEVAAFCSTSLFLAKLATGATESIGGHQIALNLAAISYMLPLGMSMAAAVRVGHAVGAQDPVGVRRAAGVSLAAGTGMMLVGAVVFYVWPEQLARCYTEDAVVASVAAGLLPVAAVFQVFDGIQVVATGILRGFGRTRGPMLINLLGYWAFGIPLGLWLCFGRGMGAEGLWWGLAAALACVALILLRSLRTVTRRRLEPIAAMSVADPDAGG